MDLSLTETLCLDIANGRKVTKRRARIAIVEIHKARAESPNGPTPGQLRYLETFTRLYDEADKRPPTTKEVAEAAGNSPTTVYYALRYLAGKRLLFDAEGKGSWRRYHPTELGRSYLK